MGQSAAVLEAVKLHRSDARAMAEAELRACQQSGCAQRATLALLTGYLELSDGEAAKARETFSQTAAPKGLEAYFLFYAGQAAFYAGDPDEAAQRFLQALPLSPPSLAVRVQARAGESLLELGRPADALPYLDPAARQLGRAELYWARAIARGAAGDLAGRLEDLRRVVVSYPSHPYAEPAAALLAKEDPRPLGFEDLLTRATILVDDEPRRAIAELAIISRQKLAKDRIARARAALVSARAHYAIGEPEQADRDVKLAAKGPPEVAAEATYARARYLLRQNDNPAARKVMIEIDRRWPGTSSAREAGFYVGWLAFQLGNLDRAIDSFEKYEKKYPRGRRRDDAMWFRGLSQLLLNRHADAQATLDSLAGDFPSSALVPQALYWSARARQLADPKADIADALSRVVALFPQSFYAVLATERLRELGRPPPAAFPQTPKDLEVPVPDVLDTAVALARAGLFPDAFREIAAQLARVRGADDALRFGQALRELGEYGSAYGLAQRALWGKAFGDKDGAALALFYPRPFAAAVLPESKARGVDPYLTWAIMRRESTFRPELLSAADARGLMQLVPRTAAAIAKELGEAAPDPDNLYSPNLNVRLGAWYLGKLTERFHHPILVAAAYNAGPPVVERWINEHGARPLDLFVELVSYRETRAYMKEVVADLHVYRALYESAGVLPSIDLTIPPPSSEGVRF